MSLDLNALLEHDMSDECPVCRAQDLAELVLIPAAGAWEATNELPRYSLALHGAAGLLGALMAEGVPRNQLESALGQLLDDIELQVTEDRMLGGPPQGSA